MAACCQEPLPPKQVAWVGLKICALLEKTFADFARELELHLNEMRTSISAELLRDLRNERHESANENNVSFAQDVVAPALASTSRWKQMKKGD